jgi:DNA-binding CsgD family transcriptional regulator
LLPVYWEVVHERSERAFKGASFSEAARTQFSVHTFESSVAASRDAFFRSDDYNLTQRVVGYDPNFLRLIVRQGGRVLGGVRMWRSLGKGAWTAEEKNRLGALEPFFVHALTVHDAGEMPLVDDGRTGLIIADTAGKTIYFTAAGKRSLFLATHPRNGPGTTFQRLEALPPALIRLCKDLARVFSDDATAAAPSYSCLNIWGRFHFRAQWMEGVDAAAGLVAITVSHEEPLPIRLIRSAERLPLSRRQAEICVLLAEGFSHEKITERLGISRHTVNEHGRWIYNKLDVHNRAELVTRLLAG